MKPAHFELFRPRTLAEVLSLLAAYHEEGKLISGGQSLVPAMNMRLATPKYLIDLNRVTELDYIRLENGQIAIGGMTRHHTLETSPLLKERSPLLARAASLIGHAPIRYRGTIGGSLAHADPAATLPVALAALGGRVRAVGPEGERCFTADEFFYGIFTTALQANEVLVEVQIPVTPSGTGHSFLTLTRRHGDFPLVSVAALMQTAGGAVTDARLAIGGVNPTPTVIDGVAQLVQGRLPAQALWREAAELAAAAMDPETDFHATAEYRVHMVRTLTVRALQEAWAAAKEGNR